MKEDNEETGFVVNQTETDAEYEEINESLDEEGWPIKTSGSGVYKEGYTEYTDYNWNFGDNVPKRNVLKYDYYSDKYEIDFVLEIPKIETGNEIATMEFTYNKKDKVVSNIKKSDNFTYEVDDDKLNFVLINIVNIIEGN